MKKYIFLFFVVIVMFGILLAMMFKFNARISELSAVKEKGIDKEILEYANILLAKGLDRQAAGVFEKYIEEGNADKKTLAKICYKVGNIYMGLYEYENALKNFYRAEMLDGEADFRDEMGQKIVEALENLGMSSQAQYELEARTSIEKVPQKEEKVVARIGKEEITDSEIDRALNRMPEWMREKYQTEKGRKEFIREYVAHRVLYKKAKRLGIDRTPQMREIIEEFKRQAVVNQLLQKEVEKKLDISPEDIELYYKANKEKYIEHAAIKISYVEVKDNAEDAVKMLKEKKGEHIERWIEKGDTEIPGIGQAEEVIAGLFLKEKGSITAPLKIKDKLYVFLIEDKRQERQKSFSEVKNQVEYEYKFQKQKEITESLLEQALEEQEVEIY